MKYKKTDIKAPNGDIIKYSIVEDKKTGKPLVRVYGRTDPVTKKVYSPSKMLPVTYTDDQLFAAVQALAIKAGFAKKYGKRFTVIDLLQLHIDNMEADGKSPTSIASYRSNIKCYVKAYPIGSMFYDEVTAPDFKAHYRLLRKSGGRNGQGLEQVTVKKLHTFLSGSFSALSEGDERIIDKNILLGTKVPRGRSPEALAMSEPDFSKLMKYLESWSDEDDQFLLTMKEAIWMVLHTAIRRGEVAGLRVMRFNPKRKYLRIKEVLLDGRTYKDYPKSNSSNASVSLDDRTIERTIKHLKYQAFMLAKNSIEQTGDTPLYAKPNGTPYAPSDYNDAFKYMVKKLGLDKNLTLHKLRHTHATYLIEAGVHINIVKERLRHSSANVTTSIYGHVLPGRGEEAAARFGALSESLKQGDYNEDYYQNGIIK